MLNTASRINYLGQIHHCDFDDSESKLLVTGVVRAPGVLTYRNFDGSVRRELVHPHLLRRIDAKTGMPLAAQLANLPITNDHPPFMLRGIPERIAEYKVGSVRSDGIKVYRDGRTEVIFEVNDPDAIDDIRSGRKRGLSLGYDCQAVRQDGQYEGEVFDHLQDEPFVCDHSAICAIPRSRKAVITSFKRFDHFDSQSDLAIEIFTPARTFHQSTKPKKDIAMATIQMGSATYEVDAAVAAAFNQFHTDMKMKHEEELEKKPTPEELEEAQADAEYQRTRADSLEQAILELGSEHADTETIDVSAEIGSRLDTWQQAMSLFGSANKRLDSSIPVMEVKADAFGYDPKLTCVEIKKQALQKLDANLDLTSKSDAYVEGRFDSQITNSTQVSRTDSTKALRQVLAGATPNPVSHMDAKTIRAQEMAKTQAVSRLPVSVALRESAR